jgi:pentatricopeptide repeat protein
MNVRGDTALSICCKLGDVERTRELLNALNRADLPPDLSWPSAMHWAVNL